MTKKRTGTGRTGRRIGSGGKDEQWGGHEIERIIANAINLYQEADLRAARRLLLKALKKRPHDTDALYTLGLIAKDQGRREEAIDYFKAVTSHDPGNVHARFFLGGLLIDGRIYDQAAEEFRAVVSLSPQETEGWYNLGFIASAQGKQEEAISHYEKALTLNPGYSNAAYNVGCIYLARKQYDQAMTWFEETTKMDPLYADAWFNLGYIAMERRCFGSSISYYEKAVTVKPDYCAAYTNMGLAYHYENKLDEALKHFEKALAIDPDFSDAYLNMGNTYRHRGDLARAAEHYRKSLDLKPSLVGLSNLSGLQKELCQFESARELSLELLEYEGIQKAELANIHDTFIQLCEWDKASALIPRFKAAAMDPGSKDVLAGSFMEFCAITDLSLDENAELHKEWGALTEALVEPFDHTRRRGEALARNTLRIGYISPDLREHSVGYLIKDIIAHHNDDEFEVYGYANFDPKDADAFTQEIMSRCKVFKYVRHLSDYEVADKIYRDGIDILIDLAGHTAGHRLRSLAYKPAPIQMTYLGYPNTTGLSRIDYRITDRYAESDDGDYRYSEKLLRLNNCFLSFKGFTGVEPGPAREESTGETVFGCFNNIQKVTPGAVALWARILNAVDNSKLHLKAKQLTTAFVWENIVKEFAKHGISGDRLVCLGYAPTRESHLGLYNNVDVALDTFPYNGTVTTLEALWMNVPVVTLVGESHAQRVGYSILKNLDLEGLVAGSKEEYVAKAVELARHHELIRELKTRMRTNLLASSICNPKVITRELELRLRKIWTAYALGEDVGDEKQGGDVIGAMSLVRMAMVKLEAKEYEKAIAMSRPLTQHDAVAALAWYILGVAYFRTGREDQAEEALETSLSMKSSNVGASRLLETIHGMKRGDDVALGLEKVSNG